MSYYEITVPVPTTGTAGNATGNQSSPPIRGEIVAVFVKYDPAAPATTTVDVDEVEGPARKILDKAASNTSVTHYPRTQAQDTTGANIAGIYDCIVLGGRKVKVTVAASDQLSPAVTVTLIIKENT